MPKGVEFIPPHSKLVNTPLQLANFPFNEIPKEEYVKEQMTTKANTTVNIRVKDFTEEDSPLRFRSYLTLFAGGTNGKPLKHSSFERNFYLAKLIKVGDVAPQYFDEGQTRLDERPIPAPSGSAPPPDSPPSDGVIILDQTLLPGRKRI